MDDLLLTQTPHSTDAEKAVLGCMLINPDCIPDVAHILTVKDFHFPIHRDIFSVVTELHNSGQPIDPVTVRNALVSSDYAPQDAQGYIASLANAAPIIGNAATYANIVRDKSVLRYAQEAALSAAKLAAQGADLDEVQAALYKAITAAEERQTTEAVSLSDATVALYQELRERQRMGGMAGLSTGFAGLDELLGGLRPGNMLVLAGRPGMGKSAFALNLALGVAKNDCSVLVFSLEMNAVELTERVYADAASMDLQRIRNARLASEDWRRLADASSTVTKHRLRIVEAPSLDMADITRICRKEKPSLVIIDHLGLVRPSGKQRDRREAMDGISRSVKCLAKDLRIPVIVAAQLNREVMSRSNKSPALSDLRESGAIEQDADTVLFVHRPAYYDKTKAENVAELVIAKNRHGKTGTVPLLWVGAYQRFADDWTVGAGSVPAEEWAKDSGSASELPASDCAQEKFA